MSRGKLRISHLLEVGNEGREESRINTRSNVGVDGDSAKLGKDNRGEGEGQVMMKLLRAG